MTSTQVGDEAEIRESVASYESSIEDAERRREVKDLSRSGLKNWHHNVANKHEAVGYLRLLLGERETARERFEQAAEHNMRSHECVLDLRQETTGVPETPLYPSRALDALYAALLAGEREQTEAAVAAIDDVVGGVPDERTAQSHYALYPSVVAGVASGAPDATERIETFEAFLDSFDPTDAALYERLLPVFAATDATDDDALSAALSDLDTHHARFEADEENYVTGNLCKNLLRCLALARWRGLTVDETFEYAPAVPWGDEGG